MPMPPGLLPVGELGKHVQMKGTHATYEMQKPPQPALSGLSKLKE